MENEEWRIGWSPEDEEGSQFYQIIKKIKIGDFFALKSLGGRHDLVISAIGIVIDTSEKASGIIKIKWIRTERLFTGKAPKGKGAGNWFSSLLEVERVEDIARIFGPMFEQEEDEDIRTLTANSDAFGFWEDEREDIYQDYLEKTPE